MGKEEKEVKGERNIEEKKYCKKKKNRNKFIRENEEKKKLDKEKNNVS